jgi:uncharacterized membrane protein (DUF2068 family)
VVNGAQLPSHQDPDIRFHPPAGGPGSGKRHLHYELLSCGLHAHVLLGTDAADLRAQDALMVRQADGLRWHRCLRCDAWIPLPAPARPARLFPPRREQITLPLRGRPLRDRYVLRLIAIDRFLHVLILALTAMLIVLLLTHQARWQAAFSRVLADLYSGITGPPPAAGGGLLAKVDRLLSLQPQRLRLALAVVLGYGLLEGAEMVGLWYARRWAEYLTFLATTVLLVPEVYELTHRVSVLKIVTLVVNVVIVVYLLWAHRLFGLRGGGRAQRAEYDHDLSWTAIEEATPPVGSVPSS